jgi:4-amino-4-deoxy-L-arabinose transferase-like glycosyltransferase
MLQRATRWRLLAIAGGLALLILYLYGLDRMGLYGPDEPRYASIGREMARSGDLVTPRLWGDPWFEKPALLYWMMAAAYRAGLSNDLAPRIPVALLSVMFLAAFFWMVRREFGGSAAAYSTMILATAGGWLGLSEVGVTDLPMAAMFGLTILFLMSWLKSGERRWLDGSAVALGAAFLAKSTPALILALPALWFGRERWRDLLRPMPWVLFLLVAAPWHIACYAINGAEFPRVLFWQHQFGRFFSPELQHVQKWWFYLPLLPAGFFPWTPSLALLFRREIYRDRRLQFLMATALWGLVFFSLSRNKLPTYLLPLLPPLAVVIGVALAEARTLGRAALGLSALLCCGFPALIVRLPGIMSRNPQAEAPDMPILLIVISLTVFAAVWFVPSRELSAALVALVASAGYLWIKVESYPYIDRAATARPVGQEVRPHSAGACKKEIPRDWRYGLNYYTEKPLPDCWRDPAARTVVYFQNHRLLIESRAAGSESR